MGTVSTTRENGAHRRGNPQSIEAIKMSVSETLAWYPSASPILVFDPFLSLRFLAKVAAFYKVLYLVVYLNIAREQLSRMP
jgi:hypothetical protein